MDKNQVTKYLKLPFQFDEELLRNDLMNIWNKEWSPQLYTMNYEGKWTSIPLYSKNGEINSFAYGCADEGIKPTPFLQHCPYIEKVINEFKCPLISARLLRLNANSEIKPHCDYKLGYEDNNFRIHIPIITNDQIEFILGGEKMVMLPGECWYTNVNFVHSVANKSNEDRVHLVLDGERNKWSDELFFSLAPRESFNLHETTHSPETMMRMIEELKASNEPSAKAMVEKLERELTNYNSKVQKIN